MEDFLKRAKDVVIPELITRKFDFNHEGEDYEYDGHQEINLQGAQWDCVVTHKQTGISASGRAEGVESSKHAALNDCKSKLQDKRQKEKEEQANEEAKHIRVLVISADSNKEKPIDFQNFYRGVEQKISAVTGNKEKPISFAFKLSAQPTEITDGLKEAKPKVVQFYGHGHPQGISLMDASNGPTTALNDGLKQVFESEDASTVKCILLTACHSLDTAKALSQVIDFTIGTSDNPTNEESTTFSARFYNELASGKDWEGAFKGANTELSVTLQSPVTFTLFTKN